MLTPDLLHDYQKKAVNFQSTHPNSMLWLDMGLGKTEWRKIGVESGWGVQVCNDINDAGKSPVDFDYYVREVEKLCLGLA